MKHSCFGIWSPTSASAQEDIWAWRPYELGRFGWQTATVTRTRWFWTAQSPECGTSTYSICSAVHQCPVVLSLWMGGYYSCTAKGSSLARNIITAFPFAPNCCNSAFPEGLVDLKVYSWSLQQICLCYFHRRDLRCPSNGHQSFVLQSLETSPPTLGHNIACTHTGNDPTELHQAAGGGGKPCVLCHLSPPRLLKTLGEIQHICVSESRTLLSYFKRLLEFLGSSTVKLRFKLIQYPPGSPKTQPLAFESFVTLVNKRQNSRHRRNKAIFAAKGLTVEAVAVSQVLWKPHI